MAKNDKIRSKRAFDDEIEYEDYKYKDIKKSKTKQARNARKDKREINVYDERDE